MIFDTSKLIASSFRGVPFFTDSTSLSSGKRLTEHNFINGGNFAEENGLINKTFKIKAYIGGSNYLDQKAALIKAFDQPGAGELRDKYYGSIMVIVDTYVFSESKNKLGQASIDISFKKEENKAIVERDIVFNVNYIPQVRAYFINQFNNKLGSALNESTAIGITDVLKEIENTIKFLEDTKGDLQAIKNKIGATISNIRTTIGSVVSLADDILSIITSFDAILGLGTFTPADQLSFVNTLRELIVGKRDQQFDNDVDAIVGEQIKTYTNAIVAGLTQTAVSNLENINFSTGDDLGSIKDDILTIYDVLEEVIIINGIDNITSITLKQELLDQYHNAKKDFTIFYTQKYSGLQILQNRNIVATTDIFNLIMERYGDITRIDEVLINNDIVDPIFINGTLKLLDK